MSGCYVTGSPIHRPVTQACYASKLLLSLRKSEACQLVYIHSHTIFVGLRNKKPWFPLLKQVGNDTFMVHVHVHLLMAITDYETGCKVLPIHIININVHVLHVQRNCSEKGTCNNVPIK